MRGAPTDILTSIEADLRSHSIRGYAEEKPKGNRLIIVIHRELFGAVP
jgi:hypothetical protein